MTTEFIPPAKRRGVVSRIAKPIGWRLGKSVATANTGDGRSSVGWSKRSRSGHFAGTCVPSSSTARPGRHVHRNHARPVRRRRPDDRRQLRPSPRGLVPDAVRAQRARGPCTETNPAHGGYAKPRDRGVLLAPCSPASPAAATTRSRAQRYSASSAGPFGNPSSTWFLIGVRVRARLHDVARTARVR